MKKTFLLVSLILCNYLLVEASFCNECNELPGSFASYSFKNNLDDNSGNNYNGNEIGSITYTEDRYGNENEAIYLNGNSYVDISNNDFYQLQKYSFTAWIKVSNAPSAPYSYSIISNGGIAGDQHFAYAKDGLAFVGYESTSLQNNNRNDLFLDQEWHMVTAVRHTDSTVIYIDGEKANSVSTTTENSHYGSSRHVFIGNRYTEAKPDDFFFTGYMDDVRIDSIDLSDKQVKCLYESQKQNGPNKAVPNAFARYDFNMTLNDYSGNNYDGNEIGSITYAEDRYGNENKAIYLDGNSYVDISNNDFYQLQTFSFNAWIKVNNIPDAEKSYTIIANGGIAGDQHFAYSTKGVAFVGYESNSTLNGNQNNLFLDQEWHMVTAVRHPDSTVIYIDGEKANTVLTTSTNSHYGSSRHVFIGNRYTEAKPDDFFFTGYMDDVRIDSIDLSPSQVKCLYESQKVTTACETPKTPFASYIFSNNLKDNSGNNYDGNEIGSITYAEDRYGNENEAIYLDGNSYVDISNNDFYQLQTFSFNAWIKVSNIPGAEKSYTIIANGGIAGDQHFAYSTKGVAFVGYESNSTLNGNQNNLFLDQEWHMVTAVRHPDSTVIYIDGEKANTVLTTSTNSHYGSSRHVFIGNRYTEAKPDDFFFIGYMDDVRIDSIDLTAKQVKCLYESQKTNSDNDVVLNNFSFGKERELSIYPNPIHSGETLTITTANFESYSLYNINGTMISSETMNEVKTNGLEKGLYILRVNSSGSTESKKIIIK